MCDQGVLDQRQCSSVAKPERYSSRQSNAGLAAFVKVELASLKAEIHRRVYAFKYTEMWGKLIYLQKYFQLHIRKKPT